MNHSPRALALGSPAERVRIGLITPSSNSVVEPTTSAIVSRLTNVTAHFSRFRVTEISIGRGGERTALPGQAPGRLAAARRCEGERHRLEPHVVELTGLRHRSGAVSTHHRGHVGSGHDCDPCVDRCARRQPHEADWARDPVDHGSAGAYQEGIQRGGLRVRGRSLPGYLGQLQPRPDERGRNRPNSERGGVARDRCGYHRVHQTVERLSGRGTGAEHRVADPGFDRDHGAQGIGARGSASGRNRRLGAKVRRWSAAARCAPRGRHDVNRDDGRRSLRACPRWARQAPARRGSSTPASLRPLPSGPGAGATWQRGIDSEIACPEQV